MIGKIFITSTGYDPQIGKHVKDPYLGDNPSFGACRPDIRKKVVPGDHIFVISGKVKQAPQFVMGGFEVAAKMPASVAYEQYPDQHLRKRADGQLTGNIIVNARGKQHRLDTHNPESILRRVDNYIVGKNPIALVSDTEIAKGREQTILVLADILKRPGRTPFEIVGGRAGCELSENQILRLLEWLRSLKDCTKN
ncbi:hypothetical protein ACLESO_37705 [Pyxidicoccus sp. 3LG]